jgi:anti-sigma factor RsiW
MSTVRPSVICDRVRSQISLELDDELSQLERAMVSAHLQRCTECRAYRDDVATLTSALRSAPLESMEYPITLRRPRRAIGARLQAGAAAAVAVVALGVAGKLASEPQSQDSSPVGSSEIRYPTQAAIDREQTMLHRVNSGEEVRLVLDGYVL